MRKNMHWVFKICVLLFGVLWPINLTLGSLNEDIEFSLKDHNDTHLLSRPRRYLVFPEGSSFQLGKFFKIFVY